MKDLLPRFFSKLELCRSLKAQELGILNDPPKELDRAIEVTLAGLARVRAFLNHPMKIHSGYRSPALNAAIGGAKGSQHMRGEAVDFSCPAFGPPREVAESIAAFMGVLGIDQLILEPGWVHMSFTLLPRLEVLQMRGGVYIPGLALDPSEG